MESGVHIGTRSTGKLKRATPGNGKASRKPMKVCEGSQATRKQIGKLPRQRSAATRLEKAFALNKDQRTACCKLGSVCHDDRLVREIQRSVVDMKRVQMEAWHLVNLHTLRLESNLALPDYSDPTFFDHCLAGVASTSYTHLIAAKDRLLWDTITEYRAARRRSGLIEVENRAGYTFLKQTMRQHIVVNAGLMISQNFKRRLHEYTRVRFGIADEDATREEKAAKKRLVNQIVWASYNANQFVEPEVMEVRSMLSDGHPWNAEYIPWPNRIKNNLNFYVKLVWRFQQAAEARMRFVGERGVKAFTIFPVSRSYVVDHIVINGSTLAGFYQRIRDTEGYDVLDDWRAIVPGLTYQIFNQNKWVLLRQAFSIEHLETMCAGSPLSTAEFRELPVGQKYQYASHLFANLVTTDGYGASVHYYRPKHDTNQPLVRSNLPTKTHPVDGAGVFPPGYNPAVLIGIDPGLRAVCTAAREVVRGGNALERPRSIRRRPRGKRRRRGMRIRKGKWRRGRRSKGGYPHWIRRRDEPQDGGDEVDIVSVTTREYHHLAGFNRFRDWNNSIRRQNPDYAGVITWMPSFKTSSYSIYLSHLDYFWEHVEFLLQFCKDRPLLKWRFFRKRMARIAIDAIAARLVPIANRDRTCVAYGDWRSRGGVRGHHPSPVNKLKAALEMRALVIDMGENMTSNVTGLPSYVAYTCACKEEACVVTGKMRTELLC